MRKRGQKNEEEFYVEKFLEVMGWNPERIERHERPDLIVTLRGHRIGLEVTMFHSDATDANGRPRRAMEEGLNRLLEELMQAVRGHSALCGVHGYLGFTDFRVPRRQERALFVQDVINLSLAQCPERGEKKVLSPADHSAAYPIAACYLTTLKLVNKGFDATWDHDLCVAFAGPSGHDLAALVQEKVTQAESYEREDLDELWLLIASGEWLVQATRTISAEELNDWEEVTVPLNQSLYDKAFLFQYMRDRVLEFDRSGGCWTIAEKGQP